jgi:hypothetical protein
MTQLSLAAGCALKAAGQALVESHNETFVALMRAEAKRISLERGWLTSDDLRVYADQQNIHPQHPNAWGSVFLGPCWQVIGRRKSAIPSSHHREIKIWQYVEQSGTDGQR